MVKFTIWARSAVALMPEAMKSILPALSAGMMPSQSVGWCLTVKPISLAIQFTASTSNPAGLPSLSTNPKGGKPKSMPLTKTLSEAGRAADQHQADQRAREHCYEFLDHVHPLLMWNTGFER